MECSAVLVCGSSFQKGPLLADYDLVIIGGGPAGLTAGLYAARANMSAVLLEGKDVGGEILNTDLIEDYPGFASVTGAELAQKMAEHALKFGLKIKTYAPVKQIRVEGDRKVIELEDGTTHRAYAVIITVGGEPTKLGVPGEAEYHGRGVSYCAVCDGAFFKGSDLAVIGGGDSAFQEGLFLTRFAKKLHVVHRRGEFRAQAILRDRLLAKDLVHTVTPATVKEIGGDGTAVKWIDVERDGKVERIPVEGVFVFVGFKPVGGQLFADHIAHDENGYLITDQFMQTSIPGVYAAGDTRAQLAKQITTAVGDATTAVLHAERYIEELKDMERAFPQAPREVVAETASRMKILTFPPGAVVMRQGETSDRFYVIAKGEAIVVHREPDGSERTLNTLHAGDYFGEVGILTGHARNATVRAKTSLEVLALDADGLRSLMSSSQKTGDEVARVAKSRERIEDGAAD
ncbi:MAG: cyclic nucleotide-binding domain-containing protein [Chloroflexi bacterium]|nr:MAG: cyclic nucleotide-binding domain-containing protein [Chloroflexota bacterium]TMF58767.1 MAG: cyclic nucleotide-binding domain-containing protein [Chloroflexota bacterium]